MNFVRQPNKRTIKIFINSNDKNLEANTFAERLRDILMVVESDYNVTIKIDMEDCNFLFLTILFCFSKAILEKNSRSNWIVHSKLLPAILFLSTKTIIQSIEEIK